MSHFRTIFLAFFLGLVLTGCYRMPENGECSTIPTTNNPDVVGTHRTPLIPGSGF